MEKFGRARRATDDIIIRRMRFGCCITKATNTHSECVTLIAFPLQQLLQETLLSVKLHVYCLSRFNVTRLFTYERCTAAYAKIITNDEVVIKLFEF